MPGKIQSKAQYRLMQAAAHGQTDKVPQSVAQELVATTKNPGKLPAKAPTAPPSKPIKTPNKKYY
jgi:hypothetical protein